MEMDFINPLFAGQFGEILGWGLAFVGLSEIMTALLMYRKKAFGGDKAVAQRIRPVFYVVLASGFLLTCLGLYGLDLHYGYRL